MTHNHEIVVIIETELIKDLLIMNQMVGKVREKRILLYSKISWFSIWKMEFKFDV